MAKTKIEAERDSFKNLRLEDEWIKSFKAHPDIHTLDRMLLSELVSMIEIHSGKQITVHFKFEDQIKRVMECLDLLQPGSSEDPAALCS